MTRPSGPRSVPYRRTQRVLAGLLALACVIGFVSLLRGGNPRDWLREKYPQSSHDPATGSYVLLSDEGVTQTAKRVREAWKPAQQVVDPSGVFLRYQDLIVAIQPRAGGGSTLTLDDEEHGYTHWYGHVGGVWGVGSPVSGTRGGGPGSGK